MPNIVSSYVNFYQVSDEGREHFMTLCKRFKDWKEDEYVSSFPMHEIFGVEETEDGPGTYNWNVENMGAKWAFVQDPDKHGFAIESAWDVPIDAVEFIVKEIHEVDPKAVIVVTSQDEMPNWISTNIFAEGELYDSEHWEWDDIRDYMNTHDTDLAEHYNAEEEDWDEEGREMMYEIVWECCSEMQDTSLENMLTSLENEGIIGTKQ